MDNFVGAATMKMIDSKTINSVGIPSMVLMERAALSVVKNIKEREESGSKIIVVAGVGNNGGDGVCVARILREDGYKADVYLIGNQDKCSIETKQQIIIARNSGVVFVNQINFDEYDIIVDSIFGIGLCRDVKDEFYDIIDKINNANKVVYAVDMPSGINTDTGFIQGIAVKANYTITFGVNKKGLILHPGRVYAGKVIVEDIGFPKHIIEELCLEDGFISYAKDDYKNYLPKRKTNSNKGTYGRVLVVAGSNNMAGACYFSAKAAYRMGAGLVQIFTCEDNRTILQGLVPEAIMTTYENESDKKDYHINVEKDINNSKIITYDKIKEKLNKAIEWCSCVVVGPGLGTSDMSKEIVKYILENCNKTMVLDADAINILADVAGQYISGLENVILTPHLKEMSRLIKCDVREIQDNMYNPRKLALQIDSFLDKANNVLVLKDATSLVLNNKKIYVNTSGNNGLATGGSGDVLSGIIAGLLAQGLNNIEAASLGVFIHGMAAESYVNKSNCYSLNASDLLEEIQCIL